MRIAQVAPAGVHPYSGVLTSLAHLAAALANRGHEVEIWQLSPWPLAETTGLVHLLDDAGVERVPVSVATSWWLGRHARRAIASRRIDIAHLHNVFSPANNLIAPRLRVPYVLTPHGGYAPEGLVYHHLRKRIFRRLFELPMLRRAAHLCVLTDAEAEEVRRFGADTSSSVTANGVAPPPPDIRRDAFRKRFGIPDGRLLLFVGRLDVHHKRLDELVRAVAQVPEWRLALVGPDFRGGVRCLEELAASLSASSRVHVVGALRGRALHEALAAADLFGLPSRSEGLPMAMLEALAHGTPALVSPEVERRIGVAAAGAGWVAEPASTAEMLRRIAKSDAESWRRRRAAATEYVRGYDWNAVAARYERIYEDVLAKSRS